MDKVTAPDSTITSLHSAARSGDLNKLREILENDKYNVNSTDSDGLTPLHHACIGNQLDMVRTLVSELHADLTIQDNKGRTALMKAACSKTDEKAYFLIAQANLRGQLSLLNLKSIHDGTTLHFACSGGSLSLVKTLIRDYKADTNAKDIKLNTPLHIAASSGNEEVALYLINEIGCDPEIRGHNGTSVLHQACMGGNVSLVQSLIRKHKADTNARDSNMNTPLHVAAIWGKAEVALSLINEFGCDLNVKGPLGISLLHRASQGGSVSLVQTLIREHKADANARDNQMNTPLHVAALRGRAEVALSLINEFGCNPNVRGHFGGSVLHAACSGGSISLVQTLIREHKADANARNEKMNTPLHVAALSGKAEVALSLINEFGCDPNARGRFCSSVLHAACQGGNAILVQSLIAVPKLDSPDRKREAGSALPMSSLDFDVDGRTPLHICAGQGHAECAEALLSANAPILIRDIDGKTPVDVSKGKARVILHQYLEENRDSLYLDYNAVLDAALQKYSVQHPITRLFVLGNPGAGKSSLVKSFKTEGILKAFGIRQSTVHTHTAGIVPSIYTSRQLGRVLLFDFAGDPEYYSSHAAILENLSSSESGNNIMIFVVDLTDSEVNINNTLHYWVSFIRCQKFTKLSSSFIFVGSHLDSLKGNQIAKKRKVLVNFAESCDGECFMIDCRRPRDLNDFKMKISDLASASKEYKLSNNASVLLWLLEKDFSNVTACPLQTVLSHIRDCGICLPTEAAGLYLPLSQLHNIGALLLLGDHNKGDCHVVLQSSKLTNEVHKLLFCKSAVENLQQRFHNAIFDVGLLPESVLKEILPPYITTQCLSCLQYCQEISSEEFATFISAIHTNQPFFFFPALCSKERSDIAWVTHSNNSYNIGWLARCTDPRAFFPPRFLHVLMLRLVFKFTLSAHQPSDALPDYCQLQRRCTMWKTGVHWLMTEGVECMVELANCSKEVVVIARSINEQAQSYVSIFGRVVSCVMEAKAEFCHSIRPQSYLFDATYYTSVSSLTGDNLFAMEDVIKAIAHPVGNDVIISVSGNVAMKQSKLACVRAFTLWNSIFPFTFNDVLHHLNGIVWELHQLGSLLDIPHSILDEIESNFPTDAGRKRRELVKFWLSSSLDPCWWHLVRALEGIHERVQAKEIQSKHSVAVELQEKLLSQECRYVKPDVKFLKSLAGVVGSKWPSLAASLALRSDEIEQVWSEGGSPQDCALRFLEKWVSREGSTCGELSKALKTISIFQ